MPHIRVKHKYQVTIPIAVRKEAGVHEGDTLDARVVDGKIVLTP